MAKLLAKAYKRPTKKEKLGISAATSAASAKQLQRHAPISATLAHPSTAASLKKKGRSTSGAGGPSQANERFEQDRQAQNAIQMKAAKLLLEAEKRDALRAEREETGIDTDMDGVADEDEPRTKHKAGASGMKKKVAKRRQEANDLKSVQSGSKPAKPFDYVDLL